MNSPTTRPHKNRPENAPERTCLTADAKRLRGLQRELLRCTGEKKQKLQADLGNLLALSQAAVGERRSKLPKP